MRCVCVGGHFETNGDAVKREKGAAVDRRPDESTLLPPVDDATQDESNSLALSRDGESHAGYEESLGPLLRLCKACI